MIIAFWACTPYRNYELHVDTVENKMCVIPVMTVGNGIYLSYCDFVKLVDSLKAGGMKDETDCW